MKTEQQRRYEEGQREGTVKFTYLFEGKRYKFGVGPEDKSKMMAASKVMRAHPNYPEYSNNRHKELNAEIAQAIGHSVDAEKTTG